jgi:ribulose-5-phosphate 4-epimerase/fuculose-1-phosphate aldolase
MKQSPIRNSRSEALLKRKLTTAAEILTWELSDLWGHVSAKTADGERFFVKHLRPPAGANARAGDVLEFDLQGKKLSGNRDAPEEMFFHLCPYWSRKGIGAVIHCHPPMAISLVATGKKIIPIHQHSAIFGRAVPVSRWVYGSLQRDGEIATKVLGDNCAMMIKGHGAIAVGGTIEEACVNMVRLERTARMILAAAAVGKPAPIPRAAADKFHSIIGKDSTEISPDQRRAVSQIVEWRYYEHWIERGRRWSRL